MFENEKMSEEKRVAWSHGLGHNLATQDRQRGKQSKCTRTNAFHCLFHITLCPTESLDKPRLRTIISRPRRVEVSKVGTFGKSESIETQSSELRAEKGMSREAEEKSKVGNVLH